MCDLHAAAAAAGRRLHQDRKSDLARDGDGVLVRSDAAVRARHAGDAEGFRGALGLDFVAHLADVFGLGSDEVDAVLGQNFSKAGVLREEAVARMHGVCAGDLAGREQRWNVEVAVFRRRRADTHAFVGEAHVHRIGVGGRVHSHRRDAEFLAGAKHPERDLAAVGDEDFVEHGCGAAAVSHSMMTSGSPNSTGWPSSIRICVTVPERGAGI